MIYFAQAENGGPIKIGRTDDLKQRHRGLESYYGCRLVILATMEGGEAEETAIHERFAHLRIRRTEQFRPDPELLRFIGCSSTTDNTKSVKAMECVTERAPIVLTIREFGPWQEAFTRLQEALSRKIGRELDRTEVVDLAMRELAKRLGSGEFPARFTPGTTGQKPKRAKDR